MQNTFMKVTIVNRALIDVLFSRILLDAGQGIPAYINELKSAMAKDQLGLQAILITHWHPDHTYGIKDVLKLVNQSMSRLRSSS
jgi:endoribonuclease LACTB2